MPQLVIVPLAIGCRDGREGRRSTAALQAGLEAGISDLRQLTNRQRWASGSFDQNRHPVPNYPVGPAENSVAIQWRPVGVAIAKERPMPLLQTEVPGRPPAHFEDRESA